MMLEHGPDTLSNLAVDAFGDYVIKVVKNWLRTSGLDIEWMKWFSGNVHEVLSNVMLPPHVANEVTMRLLRQIDDCISFKRVRRDRTYSLVMSLLTNALVHPAVTQLDFLETDTFYVYRSVDKLFSQVVSQITMLKVLRLQRRPYNFELFSFPKLQELTLKYKSTNRLLELLLVTCSNIRKLDVTWSQGVTDRGVNFLVKFTQLEQLRIWRTSISFVGLTRLLTDLPKNKDSEGEPMLKGLGCFMLEDDHVQLLVKNFKNLVMLEVLWNLRRDGPILLKNMKNLQRLKASVLIYDNEHEIFYSIGNQLTHLTFKLYVPEILVLIFECCPSLMYLNLRPHGGELDFPEFTTLPDMKSLKVVDLAFSNSPNLMASILSHCRNVRVLKIDCDVGSNAVATTMLKNNPLIDLEEMHWWSFSAPLHPDICNQIVSQCKNLKVIYGRIWWSRDRSRKLWYSRHGMRDQTLYYSKTKLYPQLM